MAGPYVSVCRPLEIKQALKNGLNLVLMMQNFKKEKDTSKYNKIVKLTGLKR